jgi:diaminohydroxyphosphoribosylaminopyrimidine deaminase / 5-amino-6-(5-phosphoribosylamino)uracil reductase
MSFLFNEIFMERCLHLAALGAGSVAPNPMVGAVLVYENRIIGEGWHKAFGGPHAEVNCFDSVQAEDKHLIKDCTLYVSLEPCSHFGKTPPCTMRIIREGVKRVVVGMCDPFAKVNGLGIKQLKEAGVEVVEGVLAEKCAFQNRRFLHFHTAKLPFVHVKWAQTADGFMGGMEPEPRLMITSPITARLVHKWRWEEGYVLIGAGTAIADDPTLNARFWVPFGVKKIIIDPSLRVPHIGPLFENESEVFIINGIKNTKEESIRFVQMDFRSPTLVKDMLASLYSLDVQSIFVEGGFTTLNEFIKSGCWKEAHVLTNPRLSIGDGIRAPELSKEFLVQEGYIGNDAFSYYLQD